MAAPTHAEVRVESCSYCLAEPTESCTESPGSAHKIRAHHTARHHAALTKQVRERNRETHLAAEVAREGLRAGIANIVNEYAIFNSDGDEAAEKIMELIEGAGK